MSRRVLRGFSPDRFGAARRRTGLSVQDVSRLAGVGTSTVHAWEAGRATPLIDLLARVMQILETPISEVVAIAPDQRYPGDWRVMKGLSQPQLAAAARIATSTLAGIERADLALTDANAAMLARLLGMSVDEYRAAHQRARQRPPGTPV
ncbi:MAG: helix-turn-helix transcriptional regulator [Actinomycetota bacterium]|nr:helix-turn-helix transcriptional regulator [Actinomycetota bacterium]